MTIFVFIFYLLLCKCYIALAKECILYGFFFFFTLKRDYGNNVPNKNGI